MLKKAGTTLAKGLHLANQREVFSGILAGRLEP